MMTRAQLIATIDSNAILARIKLHVDTMHDRDEDGNPVHHPHMMTANQLRGAEMLLARSLPTVRIVDQTTEHRVFNGDPATISNADLIRFIEATSPPDAPGKTAGKDEPGGVRQVH
jgi:hypothetical protein